MLVLPQARQECRPGLECLPYLVQITPPTAVGQLSLSIAGHPFCLREKAGPGGHPRLTALSPRGALSLLPRAVLMEEGWQLCVPCPCAAGLELGCLFTLFLPLCLLRCYGDQLSIVSLPHALRKIRTMIINTNFTIITYQAPFIFFFKF